MDRWTNKIIQSSPLEFLWGTRESVKVSEYFPGPRGLKDYGPVTGLYE